MPSDKRKRPKKKFDLWFLIKGLTMLLAVGLVDEYAGTRMAVYSVLGALALWVASYLRREKARKLVIYKRCQEESISEVPALRAAVGRFGLGHLVEPIMRGVLPCAYMDTTPSEDVPVGATKIGGRPDLTEDIEWPRWDDRDLSFIAQLRCSDIKGMGSEAAMAGMPVDGLLSFFYDSGQGTRGFTPHDRGSWRVYYLPEGRGLAPREFPKDLPGGVRYRQCEVRLVHGVTLPLAGSPPVELSLDEDETVAYTELRAYVSECFPGHQVLGNPDSDHGNMGLQCQLASGGLNLSKGGFDDPRAMELKSGAGEWVMLLQVDSSEDARMLWGHGGRLYFWIRRQDLEARNFDNTWMLLHME